MRRHRITRPRWGGASFRKRESLSEEALSRILHTVGLAPTVDRDVLRTQLMIANHWHAMMTSRARANLAPRLHETQELAKLLSDTVQRLDDSQSDPAHIYDNPFDNLRPTHRGLPSYKNLTRGLRFMRDRVLEEVEILSRPQEKSPLKKLVSQNLPHVYRVVFGREPGRSGRPADGGPPNNPYTRFVQAVLAEWGEETTADTIDTYLKDSRRGRDKKRKK